MKLALAQISVETGDVDSNIASILCYMDKIVSEGVDLLVLPEMSTTGMNWNRNKELSGRADSDLKYLSAEAAKRGISFCGSFLEDVGGGLYSNTFYYFNSKGELLGKYRKSHLFSLFGEDTHALAGDEIVTIDTGFVRVGLSICYDLRFPELFRKCLLQGAGLQTLVAAFPHPRLSHWQSLIRARAIENQVYFIAVNQCCLLYTSDAADE